MAIEGTGIKAPSKKASRMAMATYRVDPMDKMLRDMDKAFKNLSNQESTGAVKETGRGMGDTFNPFKDRVDASDQIENRPSFFSPGGGAFDPRNNVEVATAGSDFSGTFNESDFQGYTKALGIKRYKGLPPTMLRMLRENYRDDVRDGRYKEGQLINQAPVKEKPSFIEQTKNFAGSIFNTVTGTQPAAASQIPGGMPSGTQFTSSNLDAAKAPTGDTSFASYRMGGGEQQQQNKTVVTPTIKPQYEINRLQNRPSVSGSDNTGDTSFSAYVRGGGEGQQRGIVSPVSTGAPKQTVASLPSNYKSTEAEAFRKASAFKEAQGIAKRNPNVKVGVDSKGQPEATAANDSGVARAQAAAVNRKISGKSISQTKAANKASMRKAAAERNASFQARKKAGKLSSSERTAKGQRAAKKAAARKRAQAAAKKRKAKKKSKKK